jgi:tetratricopeptide (TPR) repeat protein/cold shock CspA family protein
MTAAAQLLEQAAAAAQRRDWAAAAHLLDDAPATDQVLDRRGWYHSRAKNFDAAIEIFTTLRNRRPHDYLPPYMIGFQYYQQQQWERALPYFDEALAHNPQHIKSWWRRAHGLDALGRTNAAVLAAGRILQIWTALPTGKQDEDRKRYAQACHLIAKHQIARDPAGAADLLRMAARNDPTDPYHHQQLAKALLKTGAPQLALTAATEARRLKPHETVIELTYIESAAACGLTDDARAVLQRTERHCAGWTAVRAARLALDLGDPHLAARLIERARRDRKTRGHPRVDELAAQTAQATAAAPPPPPGSIRTGALARDHRDNHAVRTSSRHRPPAIENQPTGRGVIDHVRPERGFGFLVDDGGTRRHFRIHGDDYPAKGQQVTFAVVTGQKGPAARDVRPVA